MAIAKPLRERDDEEKLRSSNYSNFLRLSVASFVHVWVTKGLDGLVTGDFFLGPIQ